MGFKTFSDLITFSRTSNATRVDNTGKLTYAPNNLMLRSEEFDNALWGKMASTITPNAAAAPNGTTTADRLIGDTAATGHFISQAPVLAASLGAVYIGSVYIKASGYGFAFVGLNGSGYPAAAYISVSLSTGAVSTTNGVVTASSAVNVGDGWWRVAITAPTTAAGSVQLDLRSSPDGIWANRNLAQNGTDGVLIWGAQLEQVTYQTLPSTYVQTVASAYYGPRFDYNPVTLVPLGLLIEEQRVNLGLYSDELDNAVWTKSLASVTANATTSPDGTANADKLTADGSNNPHDVRQTITYTAAVHTLSVYAKKDTGDFVQLRFSAAAVTGGTGFANFDLNAGTVGTIGAGLSAASITPAGNGWYRCTITGTTNAGTAFFSFYIVSNAAAPSAESGTFTTSVFLYGAQLEVAAFATSYIPTVASQVTRTADTTTMTGTNFSDWYNQSEGTIVVNGDSFRGTAGSARNFQIDDGTSANNIRAAGASVLQVVDATVVQASLGPTPLIPFDGTAYKFASAYKLNDFASVTTGAVATDTSGTVPTAINQLSIGSGSGTNYLNGHIRTFTFYPSRLSNAQLQALAS
jgi:hypothetical protein